MAKLGELFARIADGSDIRIPALARGCLAVLAGQLQTLHLQIGQVERAIYAWHRSNEVSRRLETIPGIGPITASALAVTIPDASLFRSGRHLAAWLGLVPRQNSSGGKERLGGISKQGDRYLRRLLITGAHAVLRYAKKGQSGSASWAGRLLERRPFKLVAVALANKTARIVWAILVRGGTYIAPPQDQMA
jgi:transposase